MVLPSVSPARSFALDVVEDCQLDAASAAVAES
jgi:hypothetical protein